MRRRRKKLFTDRCSQCGPGLIPYLKRFTKSPRTDSSGFFMRFMKPIPTTYDETLFRSRLEARWAVFFDQLQIFWSYEPLEIRRENLSYIPDFLLDNIFLDLFGNRPFIEIKPLEPNEEYIEHLKKVRDPEGVDIYIFYGEPAFGVENAIRIFSSGPHTNRVVLVEKGSIQVCKRCKWFTWVNSFGDRSETLCECKLHLCKPDIDTKRAYKIANEYRFDLKRPDNGI